MTSKSQQESPNRGENNILSQLARRAERDNILLFFLSVFHHGSSIIGARTQRAWEWLARADTDAGCAGRMHSPAGAQGLKVPLSFGNVETNFPECNHQFLLSLLFIKKYWRSSCVLTKYQRKILAWIKPKEPKTWMNICIEKGDPW